MAYLQDGRNANTNLATITVTLTGVAAGSTLVAFFVVEQIGLTNSCSDSVNGAFTQNVHFSDGASTSDIYAFTLPNVSSGSHTITGTTSTGTLNNLILYVCELSAPASLVVDGTPTGLERIDPGTLTDQITAGSVTTSVNNSVVLSFCWDIIGHATFVPGTGFTNSTSGAGVDTAGGRFNVEHKTQATAGAVIATWTDATNGSLDTYEVIEIAIKAPTGGPTGPDGEFCFVM